MTEKTHNGKISSKTDNSGGSRFFDAKKGGQIMGCDHKRLKTVGFDWFCADCGEQLDPAVLFGKKEQGQNPPAEEQTGKPTEKKTAAKKAAKKGE